MRDLIHRFNFKTKPWAFLLCLASFALIFVVNVKNANAEIFPDAINATVSPANPKLNQNATISASVKPDSLSKVNLGSLNTFTFYVKNLTTNQDVVSNKTGSGSSIANITFPVRSPGFQTGQNNLEVHIAYIIVGTGSVVTMDFKGNLSLSVSPADATSPASLQLSHTFVASESNSSAFKYNFTLNFNPGATGQNPTSYNFDCGNGSTGQVTNLTAATFTCTYKTKDAFTVKANAVGAGSSILASAQDTVTADESGSPVNNPQTKEGNVLLGFLNQLINAIVGLLQELLYLVFYYLIAPIIQAMLNIRTYTDVFAAVIYPGWEVVRNVCNILFIVALIAIGLGTLFRVESYQYKHLLVDLIIAALLVNFSLVIAQAVLGVADTVQSQFLPNNVEVIRSLARDLMAGWKTLNWSNVSGSGYFSNTVQPLFALALSIGSFIVFAALAGFLVIRIVMLWVLLMLSPLAYAMRVLPSTKSYAAKWWGEFLKYAFFTPIIAFFLNMAAVINNQYNAAFNGSGSVLQKLIDDPSLVGNSSLAAFVFSVGSNVIILVFIVIAIKAAEEAGVFGADAVAKAAKGGLLAPFQATAGLAKLGAGKAKQYYDEKTAAWADASGGRFNWKGKLGKSAFALGHLPSFVKAVGADTKRDQELIHHYIEAQALKVKRQTPFVKRKSRDPSFHAMLEEGEKRLNEVYGEYTGSESAEVGRALELEEEAKKGDLKAQMMLAAQIKRMIKGKNHNQWIHDRNKRDYKKGLGHNQANFKGTLHDLQHKGIFSHSFVEEFETTSSNIGYENNDASLTELTVNETPIEVQYIDDTDHSKGYKFVGESEWTDLHNSAENYVKNLQNFAQLSIKERDEEYEKYVEGVLKEIESPNSTGQQGYRQAASNLSQNNGNFLQHYKNYDLRQQGILMRNVNMSKKETLNNWHNSDFTTDVNGRIIKGDGGDYTGSHADFRDAWAAARGRIEKKKIDWFNKYLDQESEVNPGQKFGFADEVKWQKENYKMEMKRENKFIKDSDAQKEAEKRAMRFFTLYYAGTTGIQPDETIRKFNIAVNKANNPTLSDEAAAKLSTVTKENFIDFITGNDPGVTPASLTASNDFRNKMMDEVRNFSGGRTQ